MEDELLSLLKSEGAGHGSVVSFEERPGGTSIDVDDNDEARIYLPLSAEYMTDFDAIFLLANSRHAAVAAEKAAADTGAVIVDLRGGGNGSREYENVPPTEQFIVASLLKAAGVGNVRSISWTLYESASVEGEKGVRELFSQTASILNFKKPEPDVFKEQVAFNILPRSPVPGSDVESDVKEISGFSGFLSRTVVQIPVFHGSSASFLMEVFPGHQNASIAMVEALEKIPVFSRQREISGFYHPEQRPDIEFYIESAGTDRIWGWIRFDKYKSHAAMAVERMVSRLEKKGKKR